MCFPCDLEGVGSYRVLYPYSQLETQGGFTCEIATEGVTDSRGRLLVNIPAAAVGGAESAADEEFLSYDAYVIQRPLELVYAPLAAWLKSRGKRVVVDVDDWFEAIPRGNDGAGQIRRSARHDTGTVKRTIGHADALTVTTPRLAELYGRDVDTFILPNYLLRANWAGITPAYEQDRGRIRVGWQGWLSYRGNDLKILKKWLKPWLRRHPEAVFVNVGKPDVIPYLRLDEGTFIHVDGAVFPAHAPRVARIDIGLVPLTHNVFNECKSSLKGQEYGACGSPFVASNTEPYRAWCDGDNGVIASKPTDWPDALDALLENDLWRQMGRKNKEKAENHMIDEMWVGWKDVYQ